MLVSLRWLAEYVDLTLEPEVLAEKLTMAGTEVASVTVIGANWGPVYIAEILGLEKHPNADRLQLATVSYGHGEPITVVTGASNIAVGDKVPLALVGACLIDGHAAEPVEVVLKPSKIRGIKSEGMLCSALELGLGGDHKGIYILDSDAPVGATAKEYLSDTILDLDVTPNRADLLSMLGVAREVAALTGQTVRMPKIEYSESSEAAASMVKVTIDAPGACSRYSATIISDLRLAPSPEWLCRRLWAAGMRPINNAVDITNYVMLELGQPLHAFDLARVRGRVINVRFARDGEKLVTLDSLDRELSEDTLLITDAEGPVALAGVMGGENSEVVETTTSILLESANFDQSCIRRTARRLRLMSEASKRFERGIPVETTAMAARRATQLMLALCGGIAAFGVIDNYPEKKPVRTVSLKENEIPRLLGLSYPREQVLSVLNGLGFEVRAEAGVLDLRVPGHRLDINLPADVVEEVARVIGYDTIPTTLLRGEIPNPFPQGSLDLEKRIRRILVGLGFTEIITHSLVASDAVERLYARASGGSQDAVLSGDAAELSDRLMPKELVPIPVMNPLTADGSVLRTSAVPSALQTLAANLRSFDRDVCLFEIGTAYIRRDDDLPEERRVLTVVSGAFVSGREWGSKREFDYFDLKGAVEEMLEQLGAKGVEFRRLVHPVFHPGRAASVRGAVAGTGESLLIGGMGQASRDVVEAFGIGEDAFVAAVDLVRLREVLEAAKTYRPISRYPAVLQDIAVVVSDEVPAAEVERTIEVAGGVLARKVELFDVYRGAPLPDGKKSLAYHISYQSEEKTLTDSEVAAVHSSIERAVQEQLGASIRE